MMKYLILTLVGVFPTVANAQYHSLSGGPVTDIPAYSWENPGWSEGRTDFNASHHQTPTASSPSFAPSYGSNTYSAGGGSAPLSHLQNDFGNMD